ncbi:hypothetical protein DRO26_01815 [Candidatus Bathyarchaeota archaeon]|nr:MAG: hypothetical protein DRO26_01815 [Candidatus Bathyarchaeota archaeon]
MISESKLERTVAPFYCRLALTLCQRARELLYDDSKHSKASEICKFISTLCSKNNYDQCLEESKLCAKVSELCLYPEKLSEARSLCEKARKLCPKSFTVRAG